MQNSKWTTRFTVCESDMTNTMHSLTVTHNIQITSPLGDHEHPPNDTQPNGDYISWGEGQLVSSSAGYPDGQQQTGDQDKSKHADYEDTDPSYTTTRTHKHAKASPSGPADASTSPDTSDASPATRSGHRPSQSESSSQSGDVTDSSVPTANLPSEAMQPAHTHPRSRSTSSAPSASTIACSETGPGGCDMRGMNLASSGCDKRGDLWLRSATLYSLLLAMWL